MPDKLLPIMSADVFHNAFCAVGSIGCAGVQRQSSDEHGPAEVNT